MKKTFFLGHLLLCPRARDGCRSPSSSSAAGALAAEGLSVPCCPPAAWPGEWGGDVGPGVTAVPDGVVPCREKWCHMTQEERDDSLRFNENITFGQLG